MTRHLDLFEPFWNGYAPTCSTPFLGNQTIESYLRKSVAIATLQNERRNTQLADLVVGVTLDNKVFWISETCPRSLRADTSLRDGLDSTCCHRGAKPETNHA